ncbi:hypothetical protein NL676_026233 [Syzygium grande]|nr:hypothetical protein NL676_026233 [Syzygium grande]
MNCGNTLNKGVSESGAGPIPAPGGVGPTTLSKEKASAVGPIGWSGGVPLFEIVDATLRRNSVIMAL